MLHIKSVFLLKKLVISEHPQVIESVWKKAGKETRYIPYILEISEEPEAACIGLPRNHSVTSSIRCQNVERVDKHGVIFTLCVQIYLVLAIIFVGFEVDLRVVKIYRKVIQLLDAGNPLERRVFL